MISESEHGAIAKALNKYSDQMGEFLEKVLSNIEDNFIKVADWQQEVNNRLDALEAEKEGDGSERSLTNIHQERDVRR